MTAALPLRATHDADAWENPMGLMGFEFVEFTSPTPGLLEAVFEKLAGSRFRMTLFFQAEDGIRDLE